MPPTIQIWSGREVRALREAKRMSIRAFAAHLGVSERMVSKWEAAGTGIHPRPVNQAALDSSLATSTSDEHARFAGLVAPDAPVRAEPAEGPLPVAGGHLQVRHPIDGKLMTLVDDGVFLCGPRDEPVYLPAFYIDIFPTTNADYARFVAATGHRRPAHWHPGSGPPRDLSDHPVVYVTWHDAAAYAEWAAKALPTDRQWEKAARGPRGDVYPWGNQLTPAKCNVRESGPGTTTPVERYHSGVSPFGVYDMCGNTWEWLATPSQPTRHELKGSAFTSPFTRATPSTFNDASATMLDDDTGFRCVTPAETMRALLKMTG
ncbi:SUMF1/EgtB/PvdO family nonheme iron enzyme [Sphaerisporangium sp. B11E5]|uniref:SUMF1/EgtB/PvdO family nonheme iron enzyme n=1 Tax=Sphaerisporangium sp. B11E5 TaxID=3153563 RepID=UPI00325F0675